MYHLSLFFVSTLPKKEKKREVVCFLLFFFLREVTHTHTHVGRRNEVEATGVDVAAGGGVPQTQHQTGAIPHESSHCVLFWFYFCFAFSVSSLCAWTESFSLAYTRSAHMLFTIDATYEEIQDCVIADFGCGCGILGIGAQGLGSG
jgi:hypothetical protein